MRRASVALLLAVEAASVAGGLRSHAEYDSSAGLTSRPPLGQNRVPGGRDYSRALGGAFAAAQTQPPKGQRPDLKRQTRKDDPVPPLDYDQYFPGAWTFEWRVPESPLGSAGTITGTEVFSGGTGGAYESVTEASGPDGDYTVRSSITYDQAARLFTRRDQDSRGFDVAWRGAIGGDLGGFYTIHYESEPFTHKGHTIRLKMITRLVSPLNYKVQAQIAVDGAEYVAFGNPWWQKTATR
jgi:hypothetical protein